MGKASRRRASKQVRPAVRAKPAPPAESVATLRIDLYICVALVLVTLAVYLQAAHFDFVNYDDPVYVTDNPHVRAGLTWDGVIWAFTTFHAANWSPLTWLSHMLDVQLFGLRSGWHHMTNVLLHAGAVLLLYAALERLTKARWPSAFVAFLFALHPLHVESVAWISERKDVLCAVFWFLTIWCYARYTQKPGAVRYLLMLVSFAFGLLSKPMIVTLPFVLLLLDFWPLRRANRLAVLWEKLPMFALTAAASMATFLAQEQGRAVRSLAAVSLGLRIANAVVTCVVYIVRMLWPFKLAVFYPYPSELPAWEVAMAVAILAAITILAVRYRRSHPYLAVGWLWYLGTLIPVIGLVQVGAQSSADRYIYVPMVGLAIMIGWGAADLLAWRPQLKRALATAGAIAGLACIVLTSIQLRYWNDSRTLFQHAIDVTTNNHVAHNNLANYYLLQQENQQALPHIQEALRIKPTYPQAHTNMALVLKRLGKFDDSEREYKTALDLQPASWEAHSGYGALMVSEGRLNDALQEFAAAVALQPDSGDAHYNLGRVLAALRRPEEAMAQFSEAVRLRPDHAEAHHSLGVALLSRGRMDEALDQFRAESRLRPNDPAVHYNVGTLLASAGRLDEAVAEFNSALRIKPDYTDARRALEMALKRRNAGLR